MTDKPITFKYSQAIQAINPNWKGNVSENTENKLVIDWKGEEEISVEDIKAKINEMETAEENAKIEKENLKASAKTKLIAGEPLTEEEADTIVL